MNGRNVQAVEGAIGSLFHLEPDHVANSHYKGAQAMRALATGIIVTVSVGSIALAQQTRSVREMMNDMRARYGQTFEQCQALATSRGYRLSDDEADGRLVMMFIEGCIMGRQR
jgi:hypothetical protein